MAAKSKASSSTSVLHQKVKKKRSGVHSKKKHSNSKKSKFYTKKYKGQGK